MSELHAEVVVIGGGLAAAQFAHALRGAKFPGRVLMVSDEQHAPYQRPPLSKAYLEGTASDLSIRKLEAYEAAGIELMLSARVEKLDVDGKAITLADGRTFGYDRLVLATGARNRSLPGLDPSDRVLGVRTIGDAGSLRSITQTASSAVILGAGFLGLEIAHVLRKAGLDVTVVEMQSRVLARTSSPAVSEAIAARHRAAGIRILCGTSFVAACDRGDHVTVTLSNQEQLAADVLVPCIGVVPNVELAMAAGLRTSDGILVDRFLSTSAPGVFAIGDCARFPVANSEQTIRLESVQNAMEQARCLSASISADVPKSYEAIPWFWSDQGVKLQIAGLAQSADEFRTLGNVDSGAFSVYGFREGALVSVESIDRPADHIAARKMLALPQATKAETIFGTA